MLLHKEVPPLPLKHRKPPSISKQHMHCTLQASNQGRIWWAVFSVKQLRATWPPRMGAHNTHVVTAPHMEMPWIPTSVLNDTQCLVLKY